MKKRLLLGALGLSLACSAPPAPRAAPLPLPPIAASAPPPPIAEAPPIASVPAESPSYEERARNARPEARALAASFAVKHLLRPEDRGRPLLVVAEWFEPLTAAEARQAIAEERQSAKGPPRFGSPSSIAAPHTYDHVRIEFEDGMDGDDLFEITIEDMKRVVLADRFTDS